MYSIYSFVVLYVMFLWAEFWLLARLVGNRLEKAPALVRYFLLMVIFALPALGALAIMHAPGGDLPDSY